MRNLFKRSRQRKSVGKTHNEKKPENPARMQVEAETDSVATEGRLLVMGRESTFSEEMIEYAIEMAQRMSYEIVALNSAPLSCDSFNLFSTSRNKICQEFQSISEKHALAFRQRAEAHGIAFTHRVKFDDPDAALASVQREFGNIEFVISEPQASWTVDAVVESNRPRNEVLVYSMI